MTFDPVEAAWQEFLRGAAVGGEEVSTFETGDEIAAERHTIRNTLRRFGIRVHTAAVRKAMRANGGRLDRRGTGERRVRTWD